MSTCCVLVLGEGGVVVMADRRDDRHAASLGAAIIVVTHFFETFSQQMISYEQRPLEMANGSHPAPAPPRSEIWDAYLPRGSLGSTCPRLAQTIPTMAGIV